MTLLIKMLKNVYLSIKLNQIYIDLYQKNQPIFNLFSPFFIQSKTVNFNHFSVVLIDFVTAIWFKMTSLDRIF